MAETSSYEAEAAQLQEILRQLPDEDHRSILSQLLIMSNARGQSSRIRLALQVKDSLLISMENNQVEGQSKKAIHLIFHLARLKKSYREHFGKSIFKAMSKLYSKAEKQKGQAQKPSKKKNRPSSQPPLTIAILSEEGSEEEPATPSPSMEITTTQKQVLSSTLTTF
jgi:hypothetical protein